MSNRREIEPSLDYFELRRRHEEYKNSQKPKNGVEPEPAEAPIVAVESEAGAGEEGLDA
jgi:hypothetical protein